jgi:hypothetical protein
MGHVVHWDFVVMTIAATVPMILYVVYRFALRSGQRRNRNGGYVALVGLLAFVFYVISQYIVLFLSRVREYYADRFAAEQMRDPNALASALVKIAYGLAAAPKDVAVVDGQQRMTAQAVAASGGLKAMGVFDPQFGASLALAAAAGYAPGAALPDKETTIRAMRWDLWNPWALICELSSTHPLPAKRLKALDALSEQMGQTPLYDLPNKPPEGYWDEFATDVVIQYLPVLGFLAGVGVAFGLGLVGGWEAGGVGRLLAPVGAIVSGWALGSFIRVLFKYPSRVFPERKIEHLVGEVKVSNVRSIPAKLKGTVIGRGIPGLYWSEDLVIQDDTGFMVMDYRQPLRVLEWLFGLFRAESFVGQQVTATGWYRRFPHPFLELWQVTLPDGQVHTCHNWAFAFYGSLLFTVLGLVATCLGLVLQTGG